MVEFLNNWIEQIAIAVIIVSLFEMILPNGNIKKYVHTVIGAYVVFVIVSPIITKITGKEISLNVYEFPKNEEYKITQIDTNAYVETTYINNIKQDIIDNIQNKGYKVENISIAIDTTEENYGVIDKIVLKISKKNMEISNIELVKINIDNKVETIDSDDTEEISELKTFLKEIYGTENITIIEGE